MKTTPPCDPDNQRRRNARRNERKIGRTVVHVTSGAMVTLSAGLAISASAQAATFTVSNLNDAGAGSLRQAIQDANAAAGADVVRFQPGLTGTITLTSGQLEISDSVDIQGPGTQTLVVSGNDATRVFYLYNGTSEISVTISRLTVTRGNANVGGGLINFDENLTLDGVLFSNNRANGDGGALWADGFSMDLTILNCTFSGNTAADDGGAIYIEDTGGPTLFERDVFTGNTAGGNGGGIYLYDPDNDVTIQQCTLSGNSAANKGGGIYLYSPDNGTFAIRATTISGNSAATGGGIYLYHPDHGLVMENNTIHGNIASSGNGGGIMMYGLYSGVLRNCTIASNSATGQGGGIFVMNGSLPIINSIVADNSAGSNPDLAGNFEVSFSLVEAPGTAAIADNGGNIFNQDPQLGPLGYYGGPTQVCMPAAGSPAVNAGDPAFSSPPSVDQLGLARMTNGRVDMGAVETGNAQAIPALDKTGYSVLASLLGMIAVWFLRRKKETAMFLLALPILLGSIGTADAREKMAKTYRTGTVSAVDTTNGQLRITLTDGTVITSPLNKVEMKDRRNCQTPSATRSLRKESGQLVPRERQGCQGHSLARPAVTNLKTGQVVMVKQTGKSKLRIQVFDNIATAQQEVLRKGSRR